MGQRKFICYDIDATFHRGTRSGESLGECVARECVRRGLVSGHVMRKADRLRQAYDRRRESFNAYNAEFCRVLEDGFFSGLDARAVCAIAEEVAHRERERTHVFPRELLRTAREFDYAPIAISGSFYGVVEPFARSWGFEFVLGSEYELDENGAYYGTRDRVTIHAEQKGGALKRIVDREGFTWEDSIAIGDTMGDASMLELVEHPILMNPDERLLRHFERPRMNGRGTALVIERRVVYLAATQGSFNETLPWFIRTRLMEALTSVGVRVKLL
ncbi:hypothetical protein EDM68_01960 [Candidatus Uhrbacteria bacterium]|nr:MAG: hypothetical protein EDM68_01960 [Candidatus Uhrbacteria bacterium]